ncbi:MAG: PQQ-like beta-propeller repeat protein [Bacteroidales bacterium]|nr:PQQ-like beta-propeller repeat protein [Bacteroidales bacterium]
MNTKNKNMSASITLMIMLSTIWVNLQAQDWPQWRGAHRDGIYQATGLNLDWSEKKPALLWTFREAGSGYTAPTIVGTTLYAQGAANGIDFAFAVDTETGTLKWKQILGTEHIDAQNRGNGGRGSVTVDGEKLYLIRGGGQIHCLLAMDGKILWQKDFKDDFGGILMSNWGFSESPLIDGDLVICAPGGEEGTIVALDKNSGALVWRTKELTDKSAYSSPIVANIEGVRQYIQLTEKCVAGVAAKDGKLLWKVDAPGFRTAVIPTPITIDNLVYVTQGYNFGCILIRLTKTGDTFEAETLYANRNMTNQHGGAVLVNGHVYGYSEAPGWACQDLMTGENVWSQRVREVGKGSILAVNDKLLLLDMLTGLLTVVAASPDGWKEFGNLPIPERTQIQTNDNQVWTHQVVANGKLYLRDHDLLFCFDLTK